MIALLPFVYLLIILFIGLTIGNMRLLAAEEGTEFKQYTLLSNLWCCFRASLDLFTPVFFILKAALFGVNPETDSTKFVAIENYSNKEEFLVAMGKMYDSMNDEGAV